jgi:hypothetical protein
MDTALALFFRLSGQLVLNGLFAGIGWLSLKLITLGRYPTFARNSRDWHDFDAMAFLGAAETILFVCAVVWLRGQV